jgi:Immunity protein 22
MPNDFDTVDVWIGVFGTSEAIDAYLAETYSDDDDELPISIFAAEQRQWFYDHDFLEVAPVPPGESFAATLRRLSFAASYVDAVSGAWDRAGRPEGDAIVLAFGGAIRAPKSTTSAHCRMIYLGRFAVDPGPAHKS